MPATPRPAATVILLRDGPDGPEVYMCRRTGKATFMPDLFVFPGGRVDPEDRAPALVERARGVERVREALPDLDPDDAVAHHVAAVRELFEEAGVLLCDGATGADPEVLAGDRSALRDRDDPRTFGGVCRDHDLVPRLDLLRYVAWWLTPEREPKQFRARFFCAPFPEDRAPVLDREEVIEEVWITPSDAIARAAAAELRIPPPQLVTLDELRPYDDVDAVLADPPPVPGEISPRLVPRDKELHFLLPEDPAYGSPDDAFDVPEGERERVVLEEEAFRLERHRGGRE